MGDIKNLPHLELASSGSVARLELSASLARTTEMACRRGLSVREREPHAEAADADRRHVLDEL
jgi:hypothetical protein